MFICFLPANLTAEDAWCARADTEKEEKNQYIQVDFLLKTRVTRVGTMRRRSKEHWVSEYFLQYSDDDVTWIDYQENGCVKVSDNHAVLGLKGLFLIYSRPRCKNPEKSPKNLPGMIPLKVI